MMVNRAFAASHNAQPADFEGAHTNDVTSGEKKEWQVFLETDHQVLDGGERVNLPEYTVTLPDGRREIRHDWPLLPAGLPATAESGAATLPPWVSSPLSTRQPLRLEVSC